MPISPRPPSGAKTSSFSSVINSMLSERMGIIALSGRDRRLIR